MKEGIAFTSLRSYRDESETWNLEEISFSQRVYVVPGVLSVEERPRNPSEAVVHMLLLGLLGFASLYLGFIAYSAAFLGSIYNITLSEAVVYLVSLGDTWLRLVTPRIYQI